MLSILRRIFGNRNERYLRAVSGMVAEINALEERMLALDDAGLRDLAGQARRRLADGASMTELLPESFAFTREVARRALNMRHFDSQLIGGIALHEGRIAEMKTGEGKTLVATLPSVLNALAGRKVFLVTVNDYLARRDAEWMGAIFTGLGLTAGVIHAQQPGAGKAAAYGCDIIYGTNSELGFDYLRDRMVLEQEEKVQGSLDYAIVDEVDSILIDEARTPLIISGPAESDQDVFSVTNDIIPKLKRQTREEEKDGLPLEEDERGDYWVDEKNRQVELTDRGHERVEELLLQAGELSEGENLYGSSRLRLLHYVHATLRAHTLYQRNVHYLVRDKSVLLVDEHTGRTMEGRRLSQGIHQALECKERLKIHAETQTIASTTYQNFFRLFGTLAGMTGTAVTEAMEFHQIYGLDVIGVPTNRPMVREDLNDLVYSTKTHKHQAIIAAVSERHKAGIPCLVGTASVEASEQLSALMRKAKIPHEVLNAKNHAREAEIISQAGKPGTVTIATNMAGRGTDIVLGGNLETEIAALKGPTEGKISQVREQWQQRHDAVITAGGLHVIGTERHESRRIDNQLRGRSGRQGDPGQSLFFLSLEDDLIRIFASDNMRGLIARTMGEDDDQAIEHPILTRAIARAQQRVEANNFEIRKQLLEYDDVASEQRNIIYSQRDLLMEQEDISETLTIFRTNVLQQLVQDCVPHRDIDGDWDLESLQQQLQESFALDLPVQQWMEQETSMDAEALNERVQQAAELAWQEKSALVGEQMHKLERQLTLQVLDRRWKEHLAAMDHLRGGIHLRAYAQKNPRQEYKREAFTLFEQLLSDFQRETVSLLMRMQIRAEPVEPSARRQALPGKAPLRSRPSARRQTSLGKAPAPLQSSPPAGQYPGPSMAKVGRNSPCPCGSGKKYKFCHGQV